MGLSTCALRLGCTQRLKAAALAEHATGAVRAGSAVLRDVTVDGVGAAEMAAGGLLLAPGLERWSIPTRGMLSLNYVPFSFTTEAAEAELDSTPPDTFARLLTTLPRVLALTNSVEQVRCRRTIAAG